MEMTFGSRLKHAWNVFSNKEPPYYYQPTGPGSSTRPDRPRTTKGNERSIVTAIYNRIAIDAAAIDIKHVKLDAEGRFVSELNSPLNDCLNVEANLDQTGRALRQDMFMSVLDEGSIAVVPTETDNDPKASGAYKIFALRTAKILEWYPSEVRVRLYDDRAGIKKDIVLPKRMISIIENPMYPVMNEPNSTMQRLVRKLNLLDAVDEQSSSGKLDLIIQLPYAIKTDARRQQANQRREDIVDQLTGSKYGIAYTDGTEHITQLNRPVENNLMKQIEFLTSMLYSQLGMTPSVLDGTADEKTMLNYYNRTIEPLVSAVVDEMKRKFLTKTARSQSQSIMYFRDPFRLVPVDAIAEIADKFVRNKVLCANEVRQIVGRKPSNDPEADRLNNPNMPEEKPATPTATETTDSPDIEQQGGKIQNE